jgi:hypothetical protein
MKQLLPITHENIEPLFQEPTMPEFCGPDKWVETTCDLIMEGFDKRDAPNEKVAPLGLVRFSQGGKSRGLFETKQFLRVNHKAVTVIYVTFNDVSPLDENEQTDPVEALCRRICFWFHKDRTDVDGFRSLYRKMRGYKVNSNAVLEFIGKRPCILLIDELNQFEGTKVSKELAVFLKQHFIAEKGRFFVFTSHVVSTEEFLRNYMDTNSNRLVTILKLPTIQSLSDARAKLYSMLTPQKAIYCGLSPALIYTVQELNRKVRLTLQPAKLTDTQVQELCQTCLNGKYKLVPDLFLKFMDIEDDDTVLWVPAHIVEIMCFITYHSRGTCSHGVLSCCSAIASAFERLNDSKLKSGEGWEGLFLAVLLIRIVARENHKLLDIPETYTMKVDDFDFKRDDDRVYITEIVDPAEYIDRIPGAGKRKDHISVYCPVQSSFMTYDLFLVVWDEEGKRYITGYQLKEGEALPDKDPLSTVARNYAVRGASTEKETQTKYKWTSVSEPDISSFFGVSGVNWTPMAWANLHTYYNQITYLGQSQKP